MVLQIGNLISLQTEVACPCDSFGFVGSDTKLVVAGDTLVMRMTPSGCRNAKEYQSLKLKASHLLEVNLYARLTFLYIFVMNY